MNFSNFLKNKSVDVLDEANLNEASNKRIPADKFSKIGKIAFGLLSVDSSSGRSKAKDLADVSQAKILIDKLPKKKLFNMLVQAGEELGLDLVPADGTDSNGFIAGGGGGEDCIALKLKGNDYSDNDPDGDFQADLVFALEQLTIGSGI